MDAQQAPVKADREEEVKALHMFFEIGISESRMPA
jgi:hypothetical protein